MIEYEFVHSRAPVLSNAKAVDGYLLAPGIVFRILYGGWEVIDCTAVARYR